jgi:hypothetical protein
MFFFIWGYEQIGFLVSARLCNIRRAQNVTILAADAPSYQSQKKWSVSYTSKKTSVQKAKTELN